METFELSKADQMTMILKNIILEWPELQQLIDQRAEMKIKEKEFPVFLTREQLAKMFQVSKQTIDRLTDEELFRSGFKKKKIGVSVRFERTISTNRKV